MLRQSICEGVELALLEPIHAEDLFRLTHRNRDYLRRGLPWLDHTQSADDTRSFIRRTQKQFADNDGLQSVILVDGEVAGCVGHVRIDWQNRATWLGYWLAEPFQGRGIITAACRAFLHYSFDDLGLNRVEIRAALENTRSRRVPERLGFTLEGTIRDAEWLYDHYVDHALYGLLASEWADHLRQR